MRINLIAVCRFLKVREVFTENKDLKGIYSNTTINIRMWCCREKLIKIFDNWNLIFIPTCKKEQTAELN